MSYLQCNDKGLTTSEWQTRLEQYGPNKLPESSRNPFLVFLGYMWNPLSWAMEAAAIIAIVLIDYVDFILILSLLLCNATIRCLTTLCTLCGCKRSSTLLLPFKSVLFPANILAPECHAEQTPSF